MTYQLGLYEKATPDSLSWAERLHLAREIGFDHMELSIDESDQRLARLHWTAQERSELRTAMAEADCPLRSICLSGHRRYPLGSPDPAKQKEGLELFQRAVDLAADLGVRIIQLAGYDTYYDESSEKTRETFLVNLETAVRWASEAGVTLGFETMETPFMDTVEKAMTVIRHIHSPFLGIYPDIGNLQNASLLYGPSVADDLKTGSGHIFACHLKETIPGHYREIPFGTGHTPYHSALEELHRQGVNLFIAECWYTGSPNWRDDLVEANRFVRGKIDPIYRD